MDNLNSDPILPKPVKRTKFYHQERQNDDKHDTADETIKKTEISDNNNDESISPKTHNETVHEKKKPKKLKVPKRKE